MHISKCRRHSCGAWATARSGNDKQLSILGGPTGTVTGPKGESTLDFLVDSGATYSLLPVDVWQSIGLTPKRMV
jgi:hypothetical protein